MYIDEELETAFDEPRGKLYVDCKQILTFWFLPWKSVHSELVVQLDLQPNIGEDGVKRWFISRQNDLYQPEECVAYLPFALPFGRSTVTAGKRVSTLGCWVGMTVVLWVCAVVMWVGGTVGGRKRWVCGVGGLDVGTGVNRVNGRKMTKKWW
jgi:hypothetical protein